MTRWIAIALVVVASTAARADDDDDSIDIDGRDSTSLHGDAMVWEDAPFYVEPWSGGTAVRMSTLGRGRLAEVGKAIPVKIVSATLRDFVEVELVQEPTCTWRRLTPDARIDGLHLFVKRSDLAPVITKSFAIAYANGTSARLQPGLPVMPLHDGTYAVAARGDALHIPIPHANVGFTYTRGRIEPEPRNARWRLERNRPVKLGDEELEAFAPWTSAKPAKRGASLLLDWHARCLDLVVAVPAATKLRQMPVPIEAGIGRGYGTITPPNQIARGTILSTAGGREVAIAIQPIAVTAPVDGKACFDARMSMSRLDDTPVPGTALRTFKLCAPADAVEGPHAVATTPRLRDPLAAPDDVGAPPRDAKRTANGVFYKRLQPGKPGARKPTADDSVVVHYTGWTTDGAMFDSSVKRGEPARFSLRALIAGFAEGLQVMSVGEQVRFWIPEELAYKSAPQGPQGMLVFDVELLGID